MTGGEPRQGEGAWPHGSGPVGVAAATPTMTGAVCFDTSPVANCVVAAAKDGHGRWWEVRCVDLARVPIGHSLVLTLRPQRAPLRGILLEKIHAVY